MMETGPSRRGAAMRVLVIEDDRELAEAIGVGLRREHLAVDVSFDGRAGLERALVTGYDVIVLDRDLPGRRRDDVCAELVGPAPQPGAHADRGRHDRGPGGRPGPRRRRLPAQAVRVRRARGQDPGAAAPGPARTSPVLVSGDLGRPVPAARQPGRPAPRPRPQGVRRAGVAAVRPGPGRVGRGTPGAGLGRDGRPVHQHGQGDHEQAAAQARQPAGHRDRGPGRYRI